MDSKAISKVLREVKKEVGSVIKLKPELRFKLKSKLLQIALGIVQQSVAEKILASGDYQVIFKTECLYNGKDSYGWAYEVVVAEVNYIVYKRVEDEYNYPKDYFNMNY